VLTRQLPARVAGGLVLAVAALVPPAGCDGDKKKETGPRVIVKGKLRDNGQPITIDTAKLPPGDAGIRIEFQPLEAGAEPIPATFDPPSSSFEVRGLDGKGIKVGEYRISVHVGAFGSADRYKGKYASGKSPIIRNIQGNDGETVEVTIDVANPNPKS
jgi:hypothetical protein